ncbi:hypothetical protein [Rhodoferax sediminis]|uniref:Uncharacterized protein n=1 Tax=Rhodoferax sediminis TaxID=2509614 RepID=A0A515DG83_9BURK|nr:hypothetical protein [Rhodoferax sediminis]QDL39408.1 hypothetical protein EUB48_20335 [Rhodoferax sediminis]
MTAAAREVLEDCRGAIDGLVDGIQGRDWRRQWILSIVLLRAIGHVLDKVDGSRSSAARAAIDKWWAGVKQARPSIFWDFIEEERNSVLKQYQSNAGQGVTVRLSGMQMGANGAPSKVDPPMPAIYHYVLNDGPFKGRDHRDVLRKALAWWEQQLATVDEAIQGSA